MKFLTSVLAGLLISQPANAGINSIFDVAYNGAGFADEDMYTYDSSISEPPYGSVDNENGSSAWSSSSITDVWAACDTFGGYSSAASGFIEFYFTVDDGDSGTTDGFIGLEFDFDSEFFGEDDSGFTGDGMGSFSFSIGEVGSQFEVQQTSLHETGVFQEGKLYYVSMYAYAASPFPGSAAGVHGTFSAVEVPLP